MPELYETLLERIRDIGRLEAVNALLEWDQETYMPAKAAEPRAEMISTVAALRHEKLTSGEIADLCNQFCEQDFEDPIVETNIRELLRLRGRAVKVPADLVREIAREASMARENWVKARAESDFSIFAPNLSTLLELKCREAEHLGYEDEPYDALLDEFEPGMRTAEVADLFARLREQLAPLVRELADAPQKPDFSILQRHYPKEAQRELGRHFAEMMTFDFDAGRIDESVHPFCLSMSCRDVRFTTRYDEHYLPGAIFGVMHEAGHGLYEQGLDPEHRFTPAGTYTSLGIHESQSRFWENSVGRSRPFWEGQYAQVQKLFPDALGDTPLDDFYGAINTVQPSCIRVEADEVTYNLHIVLRFELERKLLTGKLAVSDVPEAWNTAMEELVGIRPPDNAQGCLQDIHWSMGAFGYFPTYALGNLYAAQFFAAARKAMPDLDDRIRACDLKPLREWLRENVHRHGMRYRAPELCEQVTGRPLDVQPFMDYASNKFRPIYGLA